MLRSHSLSSLILVGRSGSGKSTLARSLQRWSGLQLIEVGDTVRAAAALAQTTPLKMADLTFSLGQPLEFVTRALGSKGNRSVILVGLRRPEELHEAKRSLPDALVVALETPTETRRVRQEHREHAIGRQADDVTAASLDYRDQLEAAWGIDMTVAMADAQVDSTLPQRALRREIGALWTRHSAHIAA